VTLPNWSTGVEVQVKSLFWASTATAIQLELATHSVQGHNVEIGGVLKKVFIKQCSKSIVP